MEHKVTVADMKEEEKKLAAAIITTRPKIECIVHVFPYVAVEKKA